MGNIQKTLERQADQIEATLAAHCTPSRVTGGTVTPRWVRFQVLPAVGSKLAKIKRLNEELAAALDILVRAGFRALGHAGAAHPVHPGAGRARLRARRGCGRGKECESRSLPGLTWVALVVR